MTEKIKILALALLLAVGLLLGGFTAGWSLRCHQMPVPTNDTITTVDLDTVGIQGTAVRPEADSLIRIDSIPYPVPVPYPVPQYVEGETIVIHDTVEVYLPREHRFFSIPDTLDVWYSGIMPKIDSVNIYERHTTQIINNEIVKYQRPKFGLEVGMGMTYIPTNNRVGGYAIAKASYNTGRCSFGLFAAYHTEGIPAFGGQITYQIINPR